MTDFTVSEVSRYYAERVPGLQRPEHGNWRGPCPAHEGHDANFSVDRQTGMAYCHSQCRRGWDIFALEMELTRVDFIKAKLAVFSILGRSTPQPPDRDVVAIYDYTDETGKLLYQVVRKWPKKFLLRRPDGSGDWIWNLGNMPRLPFNLPALAKSRTVVLCEGEKDVLTLKRYGIVASCNSEGAENWRPELVPYFEGKDVVIIPDNDEPGRNHALKVASNLLGVAIRVRMLQIPNLPEKGDVTDFFSAGRTKDELRELTKAAREFTPDFKFQTDSNAEVDKWVSRPTEVIAQAGGYECLWDLTRCEGIPTPFAELTDAIGGGLRNGEFYILDGRTGEGKTSLALQFILRALRSDRGVLMYSLEMGQDDVLRRLVSIEEEIDLAQVRILQRKKREGSVIPQDEFLLNSLMSKLIRGTKEMEKLPMIIHQKPTVTPQFLIDETRRIAESQKLGLICVDHMQLMGSNSNERKEYEKLTAISRALKGEVARELNIPVLVVSQVNRSNGAEQRNELEVRDLRGSGALEEDSATVLLLYHDADDLKLARTEGRLAKGPVKAVLKVGKARYGQTGSYLNLMHYKRCTRFESADERDREPERPLQPHLVA